MRLLIARQRLRSVDALPARAFLAAEAEQAAVLAQLRVHSAANGPGRPPGATETAQDLQVDELVCLAARALPQGPYGRFLVLAYAYPAPDIAQVRDALCWELEQLRQASLRARSA